MMGPVRGPTGIRCAPVEQDKVRGVGDPHMDSPYPGRVPSASLLPWKTRVPAPTILLLPTGHPRAGNRSAPSSGRTAAGHARHPTRPAGHRRVVTRRRLLYRLGWPGTVHAEKGAMSHYAAWPTPLGWPGGRWRGGHRGLRVTPRCGLVFPSVLVGILIDCGSFAFVC